MHLDILIVSYNRPEYLGTLIDSLLRQYDGSYEVGQFHLMQDGPNPARLEEDGKKIDQCIGLFQRAYPRGHTHAARVNIGINGNYTLVVRHMAESEADAVIVLEDDLELSPHYLNVMTTLLTYAQTSTQIGMVSAKGKLGASMEYQKLRQRALLPMTSAFGIQRWGWGMTRDTMTEFVPILEMYLDYAHRLGFPDNGDPVNRASKFDDMQRFINQIGFYQTTDGIEIDTMYDVAAYLLGRVHLCTYANFIKPIGETGIHFSEEMFRLNNFHNAELFPSPPEDFAWYEPELMLHIQTLIRRFYTTTRLNYNSGMFACDYPFDGVQNIDLVRALYEDVFGWPLTDHDVAIHKYPQLVDDKTDWPGPARDLLKTSKPIERRYAFPYAV